MSVSRWASEKTGQTHEKGLKDKHQPETVSNVQRKT